MLTVLMVTHELNHIPKKCKKMVMMKDGAVLFVGDRDEALSSEMLTLLYKYPVERLELNGRIMFFPR